MCQKFVDQNKIQLEIGLPTSPFNLSVPTLQITGIRSKWCPVFRKCSRTIQFESENQCHRLIAYKAIEP